ncbi:hypothetical protein [Thermocaproicibacter melissae]|uniref:hypothetical protein n=1 Tax=Thermocaproicibacter melissae TaxID=2966552 RepID=UPI0024B162C0|nr:hypothetical protein [Thermocaproicibacter melissae]WBY64191.1 hypothetical protein NOG13_00280 [Thermocaproicibacter melissae]
MREEEFVKALLAEGRADAIPEEYDWYTPLIGDWDFDYWDSFGVANPSEKRHVKGEWLFRRVLEGTGIEDLFICPLRTTRDTDPQPDAEYGVALRMFNAEKKCYDMVYACKQYMKRLEIHKVAEKIECHVVGEQEKWVFSDITENTFHWCNMTLAEDGNWKVNSEIFAKRKVNE